MAKSKPEPKPEAKTVGVVGEEPEVRESPTMAIPEAQGQRVVSQRDLGSAVLLSWRAKTETVYCPRCMIDCKFCVKCGKRYDTPYAKKKCECGSEEFEGAKDNLVPLRPDTKTILAYLRCPTPGCRFRMKSARPQHEQIIPKEHEGDNIAEGRQGSEVDFNKAR